jgi:hypothetical protein
MLRRVDVTGTDVSEERIASIMAVFPRRRFLQEPRDVASQKTAFFIV